MGKPHHPKRPNWASLQIAKPKPAPNSSWWTTHALGVRDDAQFQADVQARFPQAENTRLLLKEWVDDVA